MSVREDRLWIKASCLDDAAKSWWRLSLILKLGAFGSGIASIFWAGAAQLSPFIVAGLAVAAEVSTYRLDHWRRLAQELRRKLEYQDGFGWKVSQTDIANLNMQLTSTLEKLCDKRKANTPYFCSRQPVGANRALENTIESAWWSTHESRIMCWVCVRATIAAFVCSFVGLIAAILVDLDHDSLIATSRIVTSVFMLVISMGLVKLKLGFTSFMEAAKRAEDSAKSQLGKPGLLETDALKILNDYQVARVCSPSIPTCVWKRYRKKLTREWGTYREGLVQEGKIPQD